MGRYFSRKVAKPQGIWFPLLMHRLLTFALIICALFSVSMSGGKSKYLITVHAPGTETEPTKSIFPMRLPNGGQRIMLRTPEFSSVNIVAIHPFPAANGNGYGLSMKMDFNGTGALELVTRMRQGEVLVSMLNGTVIDTVTIDKAVTDGIFTIWQGIPQEVIDSFEKKYPRIRTLKSSSDSLDMTPSTILEKRDARVRGQKAEKERLKKEAEDAKRAAEGYAPPAAGTSQIPLEGYVSPIR